MEVLNCFVYLNNGEKNVKNYYDILLLINWSFESVGSWFFLFMINLGLVGEVLCILIDHNASASSIYQTNCLLDLFMLITN